MTTTETHRRGWRSKPKRRLWARIVIAGIGLILVLAGSGVWLHDFYFRWQERRFLATGNAFLQMGDYRGATTAARTARQFNPDSVAAYRILAAAAERRNDRSAISWRARIAELEPASASDLLDWARTALKFGAADIAERALAKVGNTDQQTAAYHEVAADLAEDRNDYPGVELHLNEAIKLDPSNLPDQLRLAALNLHSADQAKHDPARTKLKTLQKETAVRSEASRILLRDALEHNQFDVAVKIADEIEIFPDVTFADRLQRLTALQKSQDPRFAAAFRELSANGNVRSSHIAEFIDWMTSNNMAAAAAEWLSGLAPATKQGRGMGAILARVSVAVQDWQGLERLANGGDWTELEFLRRAYLARAVREQGREAEFRQEQSAAMNAANSASALQQLAQLFSDWGWEVEATELFWRLLDYPKMREVTLQKLYEHYSSKNDAKGLYQVMLRMAAFRPEDLGVQNNVAQLSLLLGMNLEWAHKIAARVYERDPANPAFASTYGFSCYLKGDKNTALRVFGALPDEQQHQPEIAAYYGVILVSSGEQVKAREFLAIAENASLLPEERALVVSAQRAAAARR